MSHRLLSVVPLFLLAAACDRTPSAPVAPIAASPSGGISA